MRTTVSIDDTLLDEAKKLTNIDEVPALLREGLRALIARENARRLIALGGSDEAASAPERRRSAY